MDIFYYIILFIMGTVFGSFFTLAVYRIPLKKDITHERSFCPNCNHKLGFWDMIPVLSYICFKGKCRYCGQKIRIRYLILEVLSGLVFLLGYVALNIHFPNFEINKIIYYISFIFMYVTIAIISGIDKEYRKIHLGVLLFGFIMQGVYILYLYVTFGTGMYRYGIYLVFMIILCIINIYFLKTKLQSEYTIEILMFIAYISTVVSSELVLIIFTLTMILIVFYRLFAKVRMQIKDKPDILQENFIPKTRIGFFLGISTIIVIILENFLTYCYNSRSILFLVKTVFLYVFKRMSSTAIFIDITQSLDSRVFLSFSMLLSLGERKKRKNIEEQRSYLNFISREL